MANPNLIDLPWLTSEGAANALLTCLQKALQLPGDTILNASDVKWISPFGTILLADFSLKRIRAGHSVSIQMPKHRETAEYIRTSGLLKLTESSNLSNAVTPDTLELRLLKRMEGNVPQLVADFVATQAINVGEDERYLLRIWITELLTNANDHANSESGFWICARYTPSRRDIRICVADAGIGIRTSLVKSGKYGHAMTDSQALEKALQEGVTSRPGHTGGLGLKQIVAYVKAHGGSLSMFSGKSRIKVRRKQKNAISALPVDYLGTIVTAAFDPQTMATLEVESGEESPFNFE